MPDTAQLKDNFGFVSENIERGNILAAWSVGFGGVAEGLAKMAFGNRIGAEVEMDEAELFGYAYGSILVESAVELIHPAAGLLGMTAAEEALTVNGVKMPLDVLYKANTEKFAAVTPTRGENHAGVMTSEPAPRTFAYRGEAVEHRWSISPCSRHELRLRHGQGIPQGRGRGGDERVVQPRGRRHPAFDPRNEGTYPPRPYLRAERRLLVGRRPDGSAKFIVNVLNNKDIHDEIHALLDRGGLILGICNGFQALVKSGLLPYGRLGMVTKDSPTLFRTTSTAIFRRSSRRASRRSTPVARGLWPGRHPLDRRQPRRRQVRRERRTGRRTVRQRAGGLPVCR